MSFCEVLSCKSNQDPGRTYHRFPNDLTRRKKWLKCLGCPKLKIKSSSAVCSRHFRSKDYYPGGKRLLIEALPLLRINKTVRDDKLKKTKLQTKSGEKSKQQKCNKPTFCTVKKPVLKSKSVKNSLTHKIPCANSDSVKKESDKHVKPTGNKPNNPVAKKNTVFQHPQMSMKLKKAIIKTRLQRVRRCKGNGSEASLDLKSKTQTRKWNQSKNGESNVKEDSQKLLDFSTKGDLKKNINEHKFLSISAQEISPIKTRNLLKCKQQNTKTITKSIESTPKNISDTTKTDDALTKQTPKNRSCNATGELTSIETDCTDATELKPSDAKEKVNKDVETKLNSNKTQLKRKFEETSSEVRTVRMRSKRKRSLLNSSKCGKEMSCNDRIKSQHRKASFNSKNTGTDINKFTFKMGNNISNIEQTILEMQNKIEKLEQKSILDEQKIETFKKALIQQRKDDIKFLMNEKENEMLLKMDLLYVDYDPHRICRLCLLLVEKKESLTSLVWPQKNQALIALIKNTTNIQVDLEDGMPSGICSECLQQIERIDWMRRRTQTSNNLIKKFITLKKKTSNDSSISDSVQLINSGVSSLDRSQFNEDFFEEELTDVLKIEDVFSLDRSSEGLSFDCTPPKQEPESDNESSALTYHQKLSLTNMKALVTKELKCKRCCTTFTNRWSLENHFRYCNKRFQCSECGKRFWNGQLFQRHKQRTHSCICLESKRCCYNCQIVFRWKWQLVFHVLQHIPQMCDLCDKVLNSVDHLKQHFVEFHVPDFA